MTDHQHNPDSEQHDGPDRLSARQKRMKQSNQGTGFWKIPAFLAFMIAAVIILFGPNEIGKFLGFGTSVSEEVQKTSVPDNSGISTQLRPRKQVDTNLDTKPELVIRPTEKKPFIDTSGNYERKIAELNKKIADLAKRPASAGNGVTPEQMKALLKEQADKLRNDAEMREQLLKAELDAKMAGLRASGVNPSGIDPAETERQQRLKELASRKAAREAELKERMVSDGNIYDESEQGTTSGTREGETGIQDKLSDNEHFIRRNANLAVKTVRATDIGDVSRTIIQGTIITAVLETAVDTELPGSMRAMVTRPVYSYDGNEILLPAGTRLIGNYNSKISLAQKRVLIAWNRAITPEGKSVTLAATGIDRLGRGGQEGNVDSRFMERFGSAVLITSISAIPSFITAAVERKGNGSSGGSGNTTTSAASDLASDASKDLKDATSDVLEEYLKHPPVIRIPQGTLVKVFVNQDLVF